MVGTLLAFAANLIGFFLFKDRRTWIRRSFLGMAVVFGVSLLYAIAKGFVFGTIWTGLW